GTPQAGSARPTCRRAAPGLHASAAATAGQGPALTSWMPKGEGPYNVVVLGAGTAGLVTAAGTAGLGGRVALVERDRMGGDCLNTGCVPEQGAHFFSAFDSSDS